MEIFKVENLNFTYPGRETKALTDINFSINKGEFILICGVSGCGKTTLLRMLKSQLTPFGDISGNIYFNGTVLEKHCIKEQASEIGFVMQSPDSQIVCDKVWHELAFGLESLGKSTSEIRTKVAEMASFFGIQSWFHKKVNTLSGGQKQLLNLASVTVMEPSVLILDEPTSQLDPIAKSEFLKTVEKINRELGTSVIISEHNLEEALPMADRVLVMDKGSIIADKSPDDVGKFLIDTNHAICKALPTPVKVHSCVTNNLPCPTNVKDGRIWLEKYSMEKTLNYDAIPKDKPYKRTDTLISAKDIWFRYEKNLPDVIKGLNLNIYKGELFCITGGNGTGKTTALSVISGLKKPYRGKVLISGQNISEIKNLYDGILGVLPQNPQSVFSGKTVYLDLMEIVSKKKLSDVKKDELLKKTAAICRIEDLMNYHPYDLSGGQQQSCALAKVLLAEPEILLLDEPTKGMDAQFKDDFATILNELKEKGVTIVMVSHDIEFCASYADRCALFFDGNIVSVNTPREFFKGNSFYTTAANRMARTILPDAILAEDIIKACGGSSNTDKKQIQNNKTDIISENDTVPIATQKNEPVKAKKNYRNKISVKSLISVFPILILIPLTIYFGTSFLDDRKYYFISLLIILETIIAFCMIFETGKPKVREIVTISVLCAIAIAGRTAFFMIPQFKPVAAVVIIAGVCLGKEAGFMVGAVSGFVSNFFFGQGPWTPWQMFAFGIIGFFAGLIFERGLIKSTKINLCIFGFLASFLIYGGIMNPASVIMAQNKITSGMIISAYIAAIPFDLIHGVSTSFFLWLISDAMIEKLERMKIKYGMIKGL